MKRGISMGSSRNNETPALELESWRKNKRIKTYLGVGGFATLTTLTRNCLLVLLSFLVWLCVGREEEKKKGNLSAGDGMGWY